MQTKSASVLEAFDAVNTLIYYFKTNVHASNPVLADQNVRLLHAVHSAVYEANKFDDQSSLQQDAANA